MDDMIEKEEEKTRPATPSAASAPTTKGTGDEAYDSAKRARLAEFDTKHAAQQAETNPAPAQSTPYTEGMGNETYAAKNDNGQAAERERAREAERALKDPNKGQRDWSFADSLNRVLNINDKTPNSQKKVKQLLYGLSAFASGWVGRDNEIMNAAVADFRSKRDSDMAIDRADSAHLNTMEAKQADADIAANSTAKSNEAQAKQYAETKGKEGTPEYEAAYSERIAKLQNLGTEGQGEVTLAVQGGTALDLQKQAQEFAAAEAAAGRELTREQLYQQNKQYYDGLSQADRNSALDRDMAKYQQARSIAEAKRSQESSQKHQTEMQKTGIKAASESQASAQDHSLKLLQENFRLSEAQTKELTKFANQEAVRQSGIMDLYATMPNLPPNLLQQLVEAKPDERKQIMAANGIKGSGVVKFDQVAEYFRSHGGVSAMDNMYKNIGSIIGSATQIVRPGK